jgi:hypothetical protein
MSFFLILLEIDMSDTALTRIASNGTLESIYQRLRSCLDGLGPHQIEPKKTSLHVTHGRAFLGVHPRRAGLLLNVVLNHRVESPLVSKCEQVSTNRYHNEILVSSPSDLDDEVLALLREAYQLTTV